CRVATFHNTIFAPLLPAISIFPSGENFKEKNSFSYFITPVILCACRSHSLMVLSRQPAASIFSSGETAIENTHELLSNESNGCIVLTFQSLTRPSQEAVAMVFPFLKYCMSVISALCACVTSGWR